MERNGPATWGRTPVYKSTDKIKRRDLFGRYVRHKRADGLLTRWHKPRVDIRKCITGIHPR